MLHYEEMSRVLKPYSQPQSIRKDIAGKQDDNTSDDPPATDEDDEVLPVDEVICRALPRNPQLKSSREQSCEQFKSVEDAQEVVCAASKMGIVSKIWEMAIVNPEKRASAAQMLVKCYSGGLTTRRSQVPALTSSPSPAIASARIPTPAPPALTTRIANDTHLESAFATAELRIAS